MQSHIRFIWKTIQKILQIIRYVDTSLMKNYRLTIQASPYSPWMVNLVYKKPGILIVDGREV